VTRRESVFGNQVFADQVVKIHWCSLLIHFFGDYFDQFLMQLCPFIG